MAYAIFIAGDDVSNHAKLDAIGLGQLKSGANFMGTRAGPDGKAGVVISWYTPDDPRGPMAFLPDLQTWTCEGQFHLGFWNDSPPGPQDFASGRYAGYPVELGDGKQWIMPAATSFVQAIEIGADYFPTFAMPSQLEPLLAESLQWVAWLEAIKDREPGNTLTVPESVVGYLQSMLELNYRLFPAMIHRLQLFSPAHIIQPLLAATSGLLATVDTEA